MKYRSRKIKEKCHSLCGDDFDVADRKSKGLKSSGWPSRTGVDNDNEHCASDEGNLCNLMRICRIIVVLCNRRNYKRVINFVVSSQLECEFAHCVV